MVEANRAALANVLGACHQETLRMRKKQSSETSRPRAKGNGLGIGLFEPGYTSPCEE